MRTLLLTLLTALGVLLAGSTGWAKPDAWRMVGGVDGLAVGAPHDEPDGLALLYRRPACAVARSTRAGRDDRDDAPGASPLAPACVGASMVRDLARPHLTAGERDAATSGARRIPWSRGPPGTRAAA